VESSFSRIEEGEYSTYLTTEKRRKRALN